MYPRAGILRPVKKSHNGAPDTGVGLTNPVNILEIVWRRRRQGLFVERTGNYPTLLVETLATVKNYFQHTGGSPAESAPMSDA